jgi:hypothetical protein
MVRRTVSSLTWSGAVYGKKDSEFIDMEWSGIKIQILTCFFLNAQVDPTSK